MAGPFTTVHASAVLVGPRAVLIRGPSGSGKSRLALELIEAAGNGSLRFTRLVGDDRVHLEVVGGRLVVRPAEQLAGLIEVRGLGILRVAYEPSAVAGMVVDLDDAPERLPLDHQQFANLEGVMLPRLGVAQGDWPLPVLLATLKLAAERHSPP